MVFGPFVPKDGQEYLNTLNQWVSGGQEVWSNTQDLIHGLQISKVSTITADSQAWQSLAIIHQDELGCRENSALAEQLDKGAASRRGKRNYQGKHFQKMNKPFGEDSILEESMLNVEDLMTCGESPVYNF